MTDIEFLTKSAVWFRSMTGNAIPDVPNPLRTLAEQMESAVVELQRLRAVTAPDAPWVNKAVSEYMHGARQRPLEHIIRAALAREMKGGAK